MTRSLERAPLGYLDGDLAERERREIERHLRELRPVPETRWPH